VADGRDGSGTPVKATLLTIAIAAAVAPSAAASPDSARRSFDPPTAAELASAPQRPVRDGLLRVSPRTLAFRRATAWWGGTYTTSTGETVVIYASEAYTVDQATNQALADFLAGLVHGSELPRLTVYVAPLTIVQTICGSPEVAGCYSPSRQIMIVPGEDIPNGPTVAQVVSHEYGHHIATNRLNTPWLAVDWGTKRWASYVGVCAREAAGSIFPGDEGDNYALNPGEGFAEAYRVLHELRAGATAIAWPIVDRVFYPDASALELLALDVTQPWQTLTRTTVGGSFTATGRGTRLVRFATPLDGQLRVRLRAPARARYRLELLAPTGAVVARGTTVSRTICGQRRFSARVTRVGAPGRFTLEISKP
jgi:hypothetical protein